VANTPGARFIDACVEGCAASHQALLAAVDAMEDSAFAEPSHLPGWTRAHLVGHLALNARSHVHLLACAARGEAGEQYEGGAAGRIAAIDAAAKRPPRELVGELRASIYVLEGAWAGANARAWSGTGTAASGAVLAMGDLPFLRWREAVVHLVDLDIGIGRDSWTDLWVRHELERQKMAWAASRPMGLTLLPRRALELAERDRLAWLIGRLEVDGLPPGPGL
jgi:maleylpyruvate isomerase